jgi:hypothetical protein
VLLIDLDGTPPPAAQAPPVQDYSVGVSPVEHPGSVPAPPVSAGLEFDPAPVERRPEGDTPFTPGMREWRVEIRAQRLERVLTPTSRVYPGRAPEPAHTAPAPSTEWLGGSQEGAAREPSPTPRWLRSASSAQAFALYASTYNEDDRQQSLAAMNQERAMHRRGRSRVRTRLALDEEASKHCAQTPPEQAPAEAAKEASAQQVPAEQAAAQALEQAWAEAAEEASAQQVPVEQAAAPALEQALAEVAEEASAQQVPAEQAVAPALAQAGAEAPAGAEVAEQASAQVPAEQAAAQVAAEQAAAPASAQTRAEAAEQASAQVPAEQAAAQVPAEQAAAPALAQTGAEAAEQASAQAPAEQMPRHGMKGLPLVRLPGYVPPCPDVPRQIVTSPASSSQAPPVAVGTGPTSTPSFAGPCTWSPALPAGTLPGGEDNDGEYSDGESSDSEPNPWEEHLRY